MGVPTGRLTGALVAALLALAATGGTAHAANDSVFGGVSDDGSVVAFTTDESLVDADQDSGSIDVYVRRGTTTELVSHGGNLGLDAQFSAISPDGQYIYSRTIEAQAGPEGDAGAIDIYRWSAGNDFLQLMSTSASDPQTGSADAQFEALANSGSTLIWSTIEDLGSDDTDTDQKDVYISFGSPTVTTVNASQGTGAGAFPANFAGVTTDAEFVVFETQVNIDAVNDADAQFDTYAFNTNDATTTLISTDDASALHGAFAANTAAVAWDGATLRTYWLTAEDLTAEDTDTATDLHVRDLPGGDTQLVSTNTAENNNANLPVQFNYASQDGSFAYFTTTEVLDAADADTNQPDVYRRAVFDGDTELTSGDTAGTASGAFPATFAGADVSGELLWFTSGEMLVPGSDIDGAGVDVMERDANANTTTQISVPDNGISAGANPAAFTGASQLGGRVFFSTMEVMEPAGDSDGAADIFERGSDNPLDLTRLISGSQLAGPPVDPTPVTESFNTHDGTHVFFVTTEQLTADDADGGSADLYERSGTVTRLISRKTDPVAQAAAVEAVHGQTILAESAGGTVLVKIPGGRFVPLDQLKSLPLGSIIDARKGFVNITSENGSGGQETMKFWAGVFQVQQAAVGAAPLEAKLVEKFPCGGGGGGKKASIARAGGSRRLWGQGKGNFRTRGARGSATVRGTHWLTTGTWKGGASVTTFKLLEGQLAIDDFAKKGAVNRILRNRGKVKLAGPAKK